MGWLLAFIVGLATVVAIRQLLRGRTLYVTHSHGFTATGFPEGEKELQPVDRDRYERILERFCRRDRFDTLWVTHRNDDQSGVVLSLEDAETELDTTFFPLKEPERIQTFRAQMEAWGYPLLEESRSNVGLGADFETLWLTYRVPTEISRLRDLVDRLLLHLDGSPEGPMYIHAWRSDDVPHTNGIHLRKHHDYIAEVP